MEDVFWVLHEGESFHYLREASCAESGEVVTITVETAYDVMARFAIPLQPVTIFLREADKKRGIILDDRQNVTFINK